MRKKLIKASAFLIFLILINSVWNSGKSPQDRLEDILGIKLSADLSDVRVTIQKEPAYSVYDLLARFEAPLPEWHRIVSELDLRLDGLCLQPPGPRRGGQWYDVPEQSNQKYAACGLWDHAVIFCLWYNNVVYIHFSGWPTAKRRSKEKVDTEPQT